MHKLQTFQCLVDNVLFMNVFQNISPNDSMEIGVHEVKNEVNVSVIFGANDILKADNVLMAY